MAKGNCICCCCHVGRPVAWCPQLTSTPRTTSLSHVWSAASQSAKVSSVPNASLTRALCGLDPRDETRVRAAGNQSHPQATPQSRQSCLWKLLAPKRGAHQALPGVDAASRNSFYGQTLASWSNLRPGDFVGSSHAPQSTWLAAPRTVAQTVSLAPPTATLAVPPQRFGTWCRAFRASESPRHRAHSDPKRCSVLVRCLRHGRLLAELGVGRRWVFHNELAQFPRCLLAALRDLVARESLESSTHVPTSRLATAACALLTFAAFLAATAGLAQSHPSKYFQLSAISVVTLILCPSSVSSYSSVRVRNKICGAARNLQRASHSLWLPSDCLMAFTASARHCAMSLPTRFSCVLAADCNLAYAGSSVRASVWIVVCHRNSRCTPSSLSRAMSLLQCLGLGVGLHMCSPALSLARSLTSGTASFIVTSCSCRSLASPLVASLWNSPHLLVATFLHSSQSCIPQCPHDQTLQVLPRGSLQCWHRPFHFASRSR